MTAKLSLWAKKGLYQFVDGQTTGPGGDSNTANGVKLIDAGTGLVQLAALSGITRTQLSAPAGAKDQQKGTATIATTSTTDGYVIVGEAGSLSSVDFSGVDALATSDTNYITWTITNLGQNGSGSNVMLATSPAGINTTKATGGTAIAANTKYPLTLSGTASNLVVAQGDRLHIIATATGTLANTVTYPEYMLRFSGTT